MIRDHRPLLVTFADKAAVREYVARTVGRRYLPEVYSILADAGQLSDLDLPDAYVVKPTHGSGAVVVVSPAARPDARLPALDGTWVYCHVRPEHVDRGQLAQVAATWQKQLYGQGPNVEWAYGPVPRQVLVEELLTSAQTDIPDDYKLFVFHQRCQYIQVDSGRFADRTQDFYLPSWERLELSGGPPGVAVPRSRPARLDEMIDVAQRLAVDTDFVRVDLYVLADRIVFGELTSYPAGGYSPFYPERFDAEFGSHWTVPRRYR